MTVVIRRGKSICFYKSKFKVPMRLFHGYLLQNFQGKANKNILDYYKKYILKSAITQFLFI